jgi:hypothetical protein
MRVARRSKTTLLAVLFSLATSVGQSQARPPEPIRYTFRVIDAAKHIAEVDARIPSSGQPMVDLMMPIWTPGFYRVEDHAGRVQSLVAKAPDGVAFRICVLEPRPPKQFPRTWTSRQGGYGRKLRRPGDCICPSHADRRGWFLCCTMYIK